MTAKREHHEHIVVGLLAACGMLASLQFTFIVPVLPLIPDLLGTTASEASWLITATLLVGVVGTPVVTRLADVHGRRRMLLVSMGLLLTGSLIAAFVPAFTAVLIGRALQGFGTAVVPIGIALLSASVSPARATMGIALMSGTIGIGSAIGLTLSGALVAWGGLSMIFWCTAAIAAVFCILIARWIREVPTTPAGRFDFVGAALLTVGLTALLLVIARGQHWGWSSGIPLWLGAISVSALLGWLLWERRQDFPLIDVRIALSHPILPINLLSFIATFGMYANHLLTTQEVLSPPSTGYGLDAPLATAGLFLLPSAITMIALAPAAARMISRFGARRALTVGSAMMAGAFVFRAIVPSDALSVTIGSGLVGAGVSFAFAAMPSLITASVPAEQTATANGVNSVVRTLSGAVAAALFAFVIAATPSPAAAAFLSQESLQLSFGATALCCALTALLAHRLRLPHRKDLP